MGHSNRSFYLQAVDIIDRIEWIGYPNKNNIKELESQVTKLQKLAPNFAEAIHQNSIKRLNSLTQEIKKGLAKGGDIPISLYTKLNAQLVIFKENLLAA